MSAGLAVLMFIIKYIYTSVCALVGFISYSKFPNFKVIFLHTIIHNSDMFRSLLIIHRELLNINKAFIKT